MDAKLTKLASPEFQKFDRNWLSVYDNLSLRNVDLEKGIAFLRPLLQDRWPRHPSFDTVYIERGTVIAEVSATEINRLVLLDLWK